MTPGQFAAIEEKWLQQCGPCDGGLPMSCTHPADDYRPVISALLAAVRERDNTIARVREVLDDYDGLDAEPIPKLSTHAWMHEVRAALDPQETP